MPLTKLLISLCIRDCIYNVQPTTHTMKYHIHKQSNRQFTSPFLVNNPLTFFMVRVKDIIQFIWKFFLPDITTGITSASNESRFLTHFHIYMVEVISSSSARIGKQMKYLHCMCTNGPAILVFYELWCMTDDKVLSSGNNTALIHLWQAVWLTGWQVVAGRGHHCNQVS